METTINDLYLKYVNGVGETLEDDRYFQYLFEMVQAGTNTLHQTNKILHKVVDERWLTTIEESLDAINAIIEKPRRFVTTAEEVVPVALAKKITADSVRHLSMNTQFIASNEDGNIQPTRVLNVTTEETYDLYENRFIYHLIQRLVTFIDKRTDVIFWSTGDEISNTLKMESKVDDAYEEIEYKIEMKIKNRQSFAENDSDNLQVFMRIDRVRRLVMALRNSSFCSLMAGCSKVRSPIQRTNLMMKDPNYRTCYKLWQFLESYDEVGYTIEERDSALEFDEEYLIQMYINLITNYTVFKSLIEGDNRNLTELEAEEREVKHPKFIKEIQEEIVDDYNIPDVEIRQVIVEEVTQAQLDAEAKLEEEVALRKAAEEAKEVAEVELENERWKLQMERFEIQQIADEQVKAAEDKAASEIANAQIRIDIAESEAKAQIEATIQESREELNRVKQELNDEIVRTQKEAEETIARTQKSSEEAIAQTQQAAEIQIQEILKDAQDRVEKAELQSQKTMEAAQVQLDAAEAQAQEMWQLAQTQVQEAEAQLQETRETAQLQIEKARQTAQEKEQAAEKQIQLTRDQAAEEIEAYRRKAEAEIQEIKRQAQLSIQEAQMNARQMIKEAEEEAQRTAKEAEQKARQVVEEAEAKAKQAVEEANAREQEARLLAQQEAQARKRAEAKADENRFSHRLANSIDLWLNGKKHEKVDPPSQEKKSQDE